MSSDTPVCEGCNGDGIRDPASPSCSFGNQILYGWHLVERCDACERFADDAAAASHYYSRFMVLYCLSGGTLHAAVFGPDRLSVSRRGRLPQVGELAPMRQVSNRRTAP